MPLYYKHNNYASFQRQLNNFGYHRKFAHFVVNNSGQLDTVYHKLGTPMSSDIEDLLTLTRQYGIGWAWWTWEGGNSKGWSHGSSEIVFRWPNGTVMVDTRALESMNRSW